MASKSFAVSFFFGQDGATGHRITHFYCVDTETARKSASSVNGIEHFMKKFNQTGLVEVRRLRIYIRSARSEKNIAVVTAGVGELPKMSDG